MSINFSIIKDVKNTIKGINMKLPKYAEIDDKTKLVEITCRGKCNCGRWAKVIEKGDTTYAECLYCGDLACDNSNWIPFKGKMY